MHSSHHTKFQPEWWLPDPVRARIDVFRPILASLYTLYKQHIASLYSQHSCSSCGFSTATMCCCGTATALVWLPDSLCGCPTASVGLPHRGHAHGHGHGAAQHGTGGARKVWRHCRPRLTHKHTPKIATPRCGGITKVGSSDTTTHIAQFRMKVSFMKP